MLKKEMENNLDKICQLIKEHVSDSLWENLYNIFKTALRT